MVLLMCAQCVWSETSCQGSPPARSPAHPFPPPLPSPTTSSPPPRPPSPLVLSSSCSFVSSLGQALLTDLLGAAGWDSEHEGAELERTEQALVRGGT
eukprot:1263928-Rhodomonas_salina.3